MNQGILRARHVCAIVVIASLPALHAEDAPAGAPTITPDALKAFLETRAQPSGEAPYPPGPLHSPELVFPAPRPPDFAPPHDPHGPSDYGGFDDIQVEWTSGAPRYRLDAGRSRVTTDGRFTSTGRASIGWLGSPGLSAGGGFLLGLSCADQWSRADDAAAPLSLRQYILDVQAGYGVPWGRHVEFDVTPAVGVLIAHGEIGGSKTVRGFGMDWGIRAYAVYTWDAGVQVGVTVGYVGFETGVHASDGSRFDLRASGPSAGAAMGVRF